MRTSHTSAISVMHGSGASSRRFWIRFVRLPELDGYVYAKRVRDRIVAIFPAVL